MTENEKKLLQAKHRLEEAQARNRQKERKARTRRLIQEGAILEKVCPQMTNMTLEDLEEYRPKVPIGKGQIVVLGGIGLIRQHREVQQALVQLLRDLFRVAAGDMAAQSGIGLLEPLDLAGLSNWYVKELEDFLPQVNIMPALVQNEIHPYYQENDVIPYIQSLGIVVQGWYPFGGRGYTADLLGNATISAIAAAHGVSSAQVILRWNLQKSVVVIPGSSNPDHIRENLDLFGFALTQDEMDQINGLDRGEKHDWY